MGFLNRGKIGKEFCGGEIRNFEDEFNGGGIWNLGGVLLGIKWWN